MTRRQKKSVHAFAAVLSSCALLAGFLIFTNISNTRATEPVVFAEILEGAVEYSDGEPAVTLPEDELLETMFADEMATFTMTLPPGYTSYSATSAASSTSAEKATYVTTEETVVTQPSVTEASTTETIPLLSNETAVHDIETTAAITEDTTTSAETTAATTQTTTSATTKVTTSETTEVTTSATTRATTSATTQATTSSTTRITTSATTRATTAATTKATTTVPAATSYGTEKTPFINVGGGTFSTDTNIYLTMFRLVNNARKEAGIDELWYSARVHEVCELRTTELTSYYSHTRPDGTKFSTAFKEKGINYSVCGENIAYGKNMFKTPEEVFQAWMDSPSHRENILNPDFECAAFGLSILTVGSDTYYYWSQEFAKLP